MGTPEASAERDPADPSTAADGELAAISKRAARPLVLTIAGSDSGGGAGIQADLKTFAAFGAYGTSVVTAVTAQNTVAVRAIHEIPPQIVAAQLDAVLEDIGADAAKTGMLSSAAIIEVVADRLRAHGLQHLVVDPVMVAKSGDRLLREDAVAALRELLLPLAEVVTPNAAEAAVLAGIPVDDLDAAREAARRIAALGPAAVIVKGGHFGGERADDLFFDGATEELLPGRRVQTRHTHGTGCTFSAAIAAGLAAGLDPREAARQAKAYLQSAIERAQPLGAGHGPVDHFWRFGDD